jgi:hypothetical protein
VCDRNFKKDRLLFHFPVAAKVPVSESLGRSPCPESRLSLSLFFLPWFLFVDNVTPGDALVDRRIWMMMMVHRIDDDGLCKKDYVGLMKERVFRVLWNRPQHSLSRGTVP